jgi:hypothetical protein
MLLDDANLLGLSFEDYNEAGIKKAFRNAALKAHPDMGGSTEWFMDVQRARGNLLEALGEKVDARQVWSGNYSFTPKSSSFVKEDLNGITSLDLCLLISHISMLYYGDTLELISRNGQTFRYSLKDFRSGAVVPFLKDYAAWSCGALNGLIDIFQPFEYSMNPKISLTANLNGLSAGKHRFTLMFGGRAFPYDFEKTGAAQSHANAEFEFPLCHTVGRDGKKKDLMLSVGVDIFF